MTIDQFASALICAEKHELAQNYRAPSRPVRTRPGMFLAAVGATLLPGVRRTSLV